MYASGDHKIITNNTPKSLEKKKGHVTSLIKVLVV